MGNDGKKIRPSGKCEEKIPGYFEIIKAVPGYDFSAHIFCCVGAVMRDALLHIGSSPPPELMHSITLCFATVVVKFLSAAILIFIFTLSEYHTDDG
jgi:hypothetical protein